MTIIEVAEVQSTLAVARLQGLDARQKMLYESPGLIAFRVQTVLDKLPAAVEKSARTSTDN